MSPLAPSHGFALSGPPFVFSGRIAPARLSLTYRLGLVVVAVTMLLLPVLYLALIVVTGAAVWWHATANTWILSGNSAYQVRLVSYATPLVAGLVLMFFMVKPILARARAREQPFPIAAADEPALFAFIDQICRQVGARQPRRVQVACHVNASAGLMDGRLGLLQRDLVLTIGLPLVAGLSARQLAGVLAHEFGHFAQGGGMRLTAIVRSVNAWFARVVYERDAWDEQLEHWSTLDWRLASVMSVARLAVWLSRSVLYVLMVGGNAISCFMLRQMEYDADSYEIGIAGSDAFIQTAIRMRELGVGARLAHGDLRDAWSRGTMPVDLPALMVERTDRMPAHVLARVREDHDEATGWFDTHPSDADRIRAAEAAQSTGVLVGGDVPAVSLFRNFDELCAAATRRYFEAELGLDLARIKMVDTDAALMRSRQREENADAIRQFFGNRFSLYRPIRLLAAELDALDAGQLAMRSAEAERAMGGAEAETARAYQEFEGAEGAQQMAFAAMELFAAGFKTVRAEEFGLPEGTATAAESALRAAADRQRTLGAQLELFETAAALRLSSGFLLIRQAGAGAMVDELATCVSSLNALAGVMNEIRELRRLDVAIDIVEGNARSSPAPQQIAERRADLQRRSAACLERIRKGLARSASLTARCGFPPDGTTPDAPEVIDRTVRLYIDLIGRLACSVLYEESRRRG
jgi:Zn-dependent protease with chaperone function